MSIARGIELAKARAAAMAELAADDPAAVLQLALPANARSALPAPVAAEVETPISAIGDYTVYAELGTVEGEESIRRTVTIDGREYPAFAYGRRLDHLSKTGIPLNGVLVNGVFVLDENAIREVQPAEVSGSVENLADGLPAGQGAIGEMGGRFYRFASRQRLLAAERAIRQDEAVLGPRPRRAASQSLMNAAAGTDIASPATATTAPAVLDTAWATGVKKVLMIRVDFSDFPGDPKWGSVTCTAEYAQNLLDTKVAPFYSGSSYGATSLVCTASPKLYRMPSTGASYATSGDVNKLYNDATAAAGADFNVAGYDRVVIAFPSLGSVTGSKITFGGQAIIGGTKVWANGEVDFRIVAHEIGHNYGLLHAGSWEVTDGDPASAAGTASEYGDPFNVMGIGNNDPVQEFSPSAKIKLGWLTSTNTKTVTASGTYRVYNFGADNPGCKNEVVALLVQRDASRTYWLSYRGNYTISQSVLNGAYVYWAVGGSNYETLVLDLATPGNTFQDSPLQVGASFTDSARGITFRTVSRGGTAPNGYLDIEVTMPGAPSVSQQPTDASVKLGDTATFTVVGTANSSYAWQSAGSSSGPWTNLSDGSGISGSATSTLSVEVTAASAALVYRCVLSNAIGTATSSTVKMVVAAGAPSITQQPSDAAALVGGSASFSMAASGASTLQWQVSTDAGATWTAVSNGSSYSGATTTSLKVTAGAGFDGYRYRCAASNANGKVYTSSAKLSLVASGDTASVHMKNLSTRCFVGTGSRIAIAGFILNQPARVIIRGVGPTLANYGVDNLLQKPVLTLFDGGGKAIASNAGWKSDASAVAGIQAAFRAVSAFDYSSDSDAALVLTLPAGAYTAQLSGANESTGNALIEVYLDTSSVGNGDPFFNVSSRVYVKTGSSIAIAGVILSQPSKILVRAVGPTLASFDVADVLQKPVIEVVDASSRVVATNSGWRTGGIGSAVTAANAATGAFALTSDNDSALVATLPAGAYTAKVSGLGDTIGTALLELYLVK